MPPHLRAHAGDHIEDHIDPSIAGTILRLNEDDRRFLLSRKPPPFLATLRNVQAKFLANELKREEHLKAAQVLSGDAPVPIRKRKRLVDDCDQSPKARVVSYRGEAGTRHMERLTALDDGDDDNTQISLSQSSQSTLVESQRLTPRAGFASAVRQARYAAHPPFSS